MRRPLFAAGCAALITLSGCMTFSKTVLPVWVGAVFFLCAAVLLTRRRTAAAIAMTAALTAALFAGIFSAHVRLRVEPTAVFAGRRIVLEGELDAYPARTEDGWRYTLRNCAVNGGKTALRVRIFTKTALEAAPGDRLRFPGARFFREGDGAPDYTAAATGVWLSALGNAGGVTARPEKRTLRDRVALLRRAASRRISAALSPLPARIAAALLLGEAENLPADFRAKLRTVGASHLFAVSGMHLTLWTGVLFLVLRRRSRTRLWANAVAAAFVVFYAALTGFSPSVLRAGIMLLLAFLGRSIRRHSDSLNALGAAALLMLGWNPFLARSPSFMLSFTAVAGILILYPYFFLSVRGRPSLNTRLRRTAAGIPNGILLSLSVLFFTVPVSAFFFSTVSLLSPLSSLLLTLPAEGVMLAAAPAVLTGALPPVSAFFFRLCGFCCGALVRLTEALSSLDFALCAVDQRQVFLWYAVTLSAAAAAWVLSRKNGRAVVCVLLASTSLLLAAGGAGSRFRRGSVELLLPDAGNATAAALVFDGAVAVQIGTGEDRDAYAAALAQLNARGVTAIRTLILPSAEPTEAGQVARFADTGGIRNVFCSQEVRKFFPQARRYLCAAGYEVRFSGNAVYRAVPDAGFPAGVLTVDGLRVVFVFSPRADLSQAPPDLRSGALLVCRGGLPAGLDPMAFDRIVVMTDRSSAALRLPDHACTTADGGGWAAELTEFQNFQKKD